MLIVPVKNSKGLDRALKTLKSKVNRTGLVKELRARSEYKKPSVKRREEISKAIYKQKMMDEEES